MISKYDNSENAGAHKLQSHGMWVVTHQPLRSIQTKDRRAPPRGFLSWIATIFRFKEADGDLKSPRISGDQ